MRYLFLLFLLAFSLRATAQDLLGYGHSTYAGITGAAYSPASLADNPFALDIQLIGFGVEIGNNYVGVRRSSLRDPNFGSDKLLLRNFKTKKSAFVRNEILLPAVMVSNDKYGWGVDVKVRTYVNVDGVEQKLAHLLVKELNDPPVFETEMHNDHLGVTMMSWAELGGTYAWVIRTGAEHFLSAGVRGKLCLGLAGGYAFLNDAGYAFHNDSSVTVYNGDLQFAHSNNFAFDADGNATYRVRFNPGIGVDAGIVYENRPEELQNEKPKFKKWPGYRDRPLYKYRIAVALCDLGAIRFKAGEFSDHYQIGASYWDLDDKTIDSTSPTNLYNTFEVRKVSSTAGDPFWMRLPLTLNVQYDYRIQQNVYVNATAFTALYLRGADGKRVHELTRLSITPRWESRWFGVWAPVSFSRLGNFCLGSGLRLGPLAIGTTDILPFVFKNKKFYSADIYFVLKVPLFPVGKGSSKNGKAKEGGAVDDCPK